MKHILTILRPKNILKLSCAGLAFVLFSSILLSFIAPAYATVGIHKRINFQGKLVNTNGTNVTNGDYSIVFTLYNADSGGTNLWDETQTVTVTDGIFQVSLGDVDTTLGNVDFNSDLLYLGIKVGADAEMTPRIRFTAVPYAFNAQKVNGLTVTNTSGNPFSAATALQIGDGKTVVVNNGLTFSGTDGTTITFQGTDTYVGRDTTDTLTNKSIGSTGLTFSGAGTDITTGSNEDMTLSPNGSGNLSLAGDFNTQVLIGAAGAATEFPLFVNNGIGSNAAFAVNNPNSGDLFVASAAGITKFVVGNNGTITDQVYAGANAVLYAAPTTGVFSTATTSTGSQCLTSGSGASGTPIWGACGSGGGGTNYLRLNEGAFSLVNDTADYLFGNIASTSAKFKLSPSGTSPTASVAGQTSYAAMVVDNKGLGDLFVASSSGLNRFVITQSGNVGINTALPLATLQVSNTAAGNVGLIVKGASGQSADLQQWQDSIGALKVKIDPSGNIGTSTNIVDIAGTRPYFAFDIADTIALIMRSAEDTFVFRGAANQSAALTQWQNSGGIPISAVDGTGKLGIGTGTNSLLGTLDVKALSGTLPVASVSGQTSNAGLIVDNSGLGDLFTASKSGATKFVIANNGNIQYAGTNNVLSTLSSAATTAQSWTLPNATGTLCLSGQTCADGGTVGYFQRNSGSLSPANITDDFLLGGIATRSAKFAFINNIGSGTPTASISAQSGTNLPAIYLTADGTNSLGTLQTARRNTLQIGGNTTGNIQFKPGDSASSLFLASNGNVGIGTATPTSAKLQVEGVTQSTGYLATSGDANGFYSFRGQLPNNGYALLGGYITSDTEPFIRIRGTGRIDWGPGGSTAPDTNLFRSAINTLETDSSLFIDGDPTANLSKALEINNLGVVTGTGYGAHITKTGASTTNVGLYSTATGATNNYAAIFDGGNVGIGTTTPTSGKLQVSMGASGTHLFLDPGAANNYADIGSATNTGIRLYGGTSYATGPAFQIWPTGSAFQGMYFDAGNASGADIHFRKSPGGADALTIMQGTGSVGIGTTTTPLATLDVRGNIGTIPAASVSAQSSFASLVVNNNGVGDLFTASKSGQNHFVVKNGGNVGIGTDNPSQKLHIVGEAVLGQNVTTNNTNKEFALHGAHYDNTQANVLAFRVSTSSTANFINYGGSDAAMNAATTLRFYTAATNTTLMGTERMRIDADGDIGIGTTGPIHKLQVDTKVTGKALAVFNETGNQAPLVASIAGVAKFFVDNAGLTNVNMNGTAVAPTAGTLCHSGGDLDAASNVTRAIVACNGAANDFAEWYEVKDQVEAGDIMITSDETFTYQAEQSNPRTGEILPEKKSTTVAKLQKSLAGYQANLIGIVSTSPHTIIGNDVRDQGANAHPIALSGIVPVKVSTESGKIEKGDYITSSSIPGVGMKSTKAGRIVGMAFDSYEGEGIGKIMVFVNTSYAVPPVNITSLIGKGLDSATYGQEVLAALVEKKALGGQSVQASLSGMMTDRLVAGLEIITPHVTTDTLQVNTIKPVLESGIAIQLGSSGELVIKDASGEAGIRFDGAGNATFKGTLNADKIRVNQIEGLSILESGIKNQESKIASLSALFSERTSSIASEVSVKQEADPSKEGTVAALLEKYGSGEFAIEALSVSQNASISGNLRVKGNSLIEGLLNVVDTLTTNNLIVNKAADFFATVIFHGDVTFKGRPAFNADTAGYVTILKGTDKAEVTFTTEYETEPVVNASIVTVKLTDDVFNKLKEDGTCDQNQEKTECEDKMVRAVLSQGSQFVISDLTIRGFEITLNKNADQDMTFSWTALEVRK